MSFGSGWIKNSRAASFTPRTDGYEKGYRTVHMCTIATIDNRVYRGAFDYRDNISLARLPSFLFLPNLARFNPSARLASTNPVKARGEGGAGDLRMQYELHEPSSLTKYSIPIFLPHPLFTFAFFPYPHPQPHPRQQSSLASQQRSNPTLRVSIGDSRG
jgi:hypothetical protein